MCIILGFSVKCYQDTHSNGSTPFKYTIFASENLKRAKKSKPNVSKWTEWINWWHNNRDGDRVHDLRCIGAIIHMLYRVQIRPFSSGWPMQMCTGTCKCEINPNIMPGLIFFKYMYSKPNSQNILHYWKNTKTMTDWHKVQSDLTENGKWNLP